MMTTVRYFCTAMAWLVAVVLAIGYGYRMGELNQMTVEVIRLPGQVCEVQRVKYVNESMITDCEFQSCTITSRTEYQENVRDLVRRHGGKNKWMLSEVKTDG